MVKNIVKRWLSFLVSFVMIFSMAPNTFVTPVLAATSLSGLSDSGIGLSYDKGSWTASDKQIIGSATGQAGGGCNQAASATGTLNITNNKGNDAKLTFNYTVSLAGGSVTIGGKSITSNGTYSETIEDGDTLQIKLTSAVGASTTSITITNITMVVDALVKTTFLAPENGSYTVNGQAITETTENEQQSTEPYNLVATPASGYKFIGWEDGNGDIVSQDAKATLYLEMPSTIKPVFVPTTAAVFQSKKRLFTDLGEAITWSQANASNKIIAVGDGTITGNYTIPSGITLLIPYDSAATLFTTAPKTTQSYSGPSAYRTITMASGSSITVANGGAISVGSMMSATGTGTGTYSGTPTGKHGKIVMNGGSSIVLNSGANLYAWGYITGAGTVSAQSGSKVYEMFQLRSFRGGTATLGMSSKAVFPMNQYYVQNIESTLVLSAGATEYVSTAITMSGSTNQASAEFIGSRGMFQMSNGSLTKRYDAGSDRLIVDINGDSTLSSISLSMGSASINSANYPLPINSNITINMNSGNLTINQDLDLLPGSIMTIGEGCKVDVKSGKNVYVYDKDQWGNYAAEGAQLCAIGYTAAHGKAPGIRSAGSLVDAVVDINGTVTVNGGFYTTESGADVKSSQGTGKVILVSGAGTKKNDYQVTQSGTSTTQVSIPITSVKLHNGSQYAGTEEEFTETKDAKANDEFDYNKATDKWEAPATTFTITFDKNADDAQGSMEAQTLTSGQSGKLNKNTFTREGYTFKGWSLVPTPGEGDMIIPDEYEGVIPAAQDITLYAQWEKAETTSYTITWKNADGTVLKTDSVKEGTVPAYDGEEPTKEADAQYTYTFKGWDKEIVAASEDATYTATYSTTVNTYTVTWKDDQGTVLETDEKVEYGQTPSYDGETPTKEGTVQVKYEFNGWTPEVSTVTGDVVYVATFKEVPAEYLITWVDEDDTELASEYVAYGTKPTYKGETPTKEATEEKTFTFAGWDPVVAEVTGEATYKAVYSSKTNTFEVKWVNYDGSVLETDKEVEYGSTPSYDGETPSKPSTETGKHYVFTGWVDEDNKAVDFEVTQVTKDTAFYASFEEALDTFTITWMNEDGTVLTTTSVAYLETPEYVGETPVKEETDEVTYTFKGWTPTLEPATADASYTAVFEAKNKYCTITWVDSDGNVLETDKVAIGETPTYNSATPTKEADAQYTYTFKGWDKEIVAASEDATYTATFDKVVNEYTVSWVVDGVVVQATTVPYGQMPEFTGVEPTKAEDEGHTYTFKGWTPEVSEVTGDVEYTATFETTTKKFTVTYVNADGTVLETFENVEYGSEIPAYTKETPTKEEVLVYAYEFSGWSCDAETVNSDLILTAQFNTVAKSGWVTYKGNDYFIQNEEAVRGVVLVQNPNAEEELAYCVFDQTTGAFLKNKNGIYDAGLDTYLVENGIVVENAGLVRIVKEDGEVNYYYFGEDNKAVKDLPMGGPDLWIEDTKGYLPVWGYHFDENGVIYHDEDTSKNGVCLDNGVKYYYIDGIKVHYGLFKIGEDYYYAKSNGQLIVDRDYYVSRTNDLLPEGSYTFDKDGKIVFEEPEKKNGIVAEDGTLYYYVDGVKTYAGLIEIDGDYYYVKTSGEVIHGRDYWISKTNGLMKEGSYTFDETGKMVKKEEPEKKNGIVAEDGTLYYYVDGVKTYAGLIEIDGSYYYVKTSGEVVHGRDYWISKTNDLMKEGSYTFDETGKMVTKEEPVKKNGIVAEEGTLFYYVDGVKTYAGLIEIDGNMYYVRTSGEVVHGRDYWVTKHNGLLPKEGSHTFDDNGIMIK